MSWLLMMSSATDHRAMIYTLSCLFDTYGSVSHLLILPRVYKVRALSSACEQVL
jgi:hypothetical protein